MKKRETPKPATNPERPRPQAQIRPVERKIGESSENLQDRAEWLRRRRGGNRPSPELMP